MAVYKKSSERRSEILNEAIRMCHDVNYADITRDDLSRISKTCGGNITRIFGNMQEFRDALVSHAMLNEFHHVMLQALVNRHRYLKNIDGAERSKMMENYISGMSYGKKKG